MLGALDDAKSGALDDAWDGLVPHVLRDGIKLFQGASNAVTSHDLREDARKREEEARRRKMKG